jgi:hypothetical protein
MNENDNSGYADKVYIASLSRIISDFTSHTGGDQPTRTTSWIAPFACTILGGRLVSSCLNKSTSDFMTVSVCVTEETLLSYVLAAGGSVENGMMDSHIYGPENTAATPVINKASTGFAFPAYAGRNIPRGIPLEAGDIVGLFLSSDNTAGSWIAASGVIYYQRTGQR